MYGILYIVMELNTRTNKILTLGAVFTTGALVAIGMNMDIPYLSVITLITGALFIRWIRKRTVEVVYDERMVLINQKASATTIAVYTLGVTAIGWVMMTWGKTVDTSYQSIGLVMAYLGCSLLLIRMIFHYYYSWRLGGWAHGEQA
jgi:uncharacterized membrane protein